MNQLFSYSGHEVRTVIQNDNPWFVAKDVCDILEISNPTQAMQRLEEDERAMFNIGRQGEANCVNESGLYSLIMSSRKPEARQFKKWVTSEVLPTIRKHGAYMTSDTLEKVLANPDTMIQVLTRLKQEQEEKVKLQAKIDTDKPLVLFAESLQVSKDSILVGEMAKLLKQNGIEIGGMRFFQWLREEGYLIKKHGEQYNMPTQRSMELGIMEVKTGSRNGSDGTIKITRTPKITGKGQSYFINKFKGTPQVG